MKVWNTFEFEFIKYFYNSDSYIKNLYIKSNNQKLLKLKSDNFYMKIFPNFQILNSIGYCKNMVIQDGVILEETG